MNTGTRLGPYEILNAIGAGGMGEVYRARDTKLNRDVAIKVLPEAFAQDAERLARFTREAQTLASLNHPNIAAIYGIEGHALVMELVEGRDLSEIIRSSEAGPSGPAGPANSPGLKTRPPSGRGIPLTEALPIARQIAEALEAAHEAGIVHRDLKPANIKVRADGTVKVLDFGLAKAMQPNGGRGFSRAGDGAPEGMPYGTDDSPTITSPAITEMGMILGTAAYMAPEQARGMAVDKRADIWAFGVVLLEMLTGQRTFKGEGVSDVLAAVLRQDIDWTALPAETPMRLRRLLERCLDRDVKQRLRDIGEARVEIAKIQSGAPDMTMASGDATPAFVPAWRRALPWVTAAVLGVALVSAFIVWSPWRSPAALITRTTLSLSPDSSLTMTGDVAISPDGRTVAFVASSPQGSGLFVRRLDELEPRLLPLTDGASTPFFSPNGQWIAFSRGAGYEKIPVSGGPPQVICAAVGPSVGRWLDDGTIVFGQWPNVGLWRVSADGGTAQVIARPSEGSGVRYLQPAPLPGARGILFMLTREGRRSVAVLAPGADTPRILVESGSHPRYVATGHLVYIADGHLMAVPFDLEKLEVHGGATAAIDDVNDSTYDVSANGVLAYLPAQSSTQNIVWKDRRGVTVPVGMDPRRYSNLMLSPDGERLSVNVQEGYSRNIWTGRVSGEPLTRLTFGNDDFFGLWSLDGTRLFYTAGQNGTYNIFSIPTNGGGKAERLTQSPNAQNATSLFGDVILLNDLGPLGDADTLELSLSTKAVRPIIKTQFAEGLARFSPDGHWIAYHSNETGRNEVYVRAYPGPGDRRQVSVGGGVWPFWSHSGRELFYRGGGDLFAVPILDARDLRAGAPRRVFARTNGGEAFAVSADDQRFLMLEDAETSRSTQLNLVQNWFEDLKARVPRK